MKILLTVVCVIIFYQGNYVQQQENTGLSAIIPDDLVELQNRIRQEKFDKILPRAMRDNNIDMWIHIMRPWTPDPLRFELGASEGVFIFTDYGVGRIERAAFSTDLQDPNAYDIVIVEGMDRESQPETPLEMDIRFVGINKFVSERDPKRIGVNYMDDLAVASSSEANPLTDGISYKDYNLLIETIGGKYARQIILREELWMK